MPCLILLAQMRTSAASSLTTLTLASSEGEGDGSDHWVGASTTYRDGRSTARDVQCGGVVAVWGSGGVER